MNNLYFRQWLSGHDYAKKDQMARAMRNLVYAIGDSDTREVILVDPTYGIEDLLELIQKDDMKLTGVLATHYHADHVGGSLGSYPIEGISSLLEKINVPIHIQADELNWVERGTGVQKDSLVTHESGEKLKVGDIEITLIHTPGHTPGSQCFLVSEKLIAGDTLFLEGCGRTDLPGSDPEQMYESLFTRLSKIDDGTLLYPGHLYSAEPFASMGETRKYNPILAPRQAAEWLRLFS